MSENFHRPQTLWKFKNKGQVMSFFRESWFLGLFLRRSSNAVFIFLNIFRSTCGKDEKLKKFFCIIFPLFLHRILGSFGILCIRFFPSEPKPKIAEWNGSVQSFCVGGSFWRYWQQTSFLWNASQVVFFQEMKPETTWVPVLDRWTLSFFC